MTALWRAGIAFRLGGSTPPAPKEVGEPPRKDGSLCPVRRRMTARICSRRCR